MLGFGYNENLASFTLSILSILLLKQFYTPKSFGVHPLYGCFFLLLLFGFYEVVYGELQIFGYRSSHHKLFSITGTFHNPGPYAIFLSPIFVVSLAILLFPPSYSLLSKLLTIASWFSVVGISIILPATQSRTAWVGTLIGAVFVLVVKFKKEISFHYFRIKSVYRVGVLLTIIFGLLAGAYLLYQYKPASAEGRALVWREGAGLFRKHALWGLGFEQFKANFGNIQSAFMEKHLNDLSLIERADYVPYAFNDFLQIILENGLIGLGIFSAFLVLTLRKGVKQLHTASAFLIGSMGALLTLIVAGFFSYPFEVPVIWVLFLFFISVVSYPPMGETLSIPGRIGIVKILCLLTIALMVMVLKSEIHLIKAKTDWKKARDLLSGHSFNKSAELYRTVLQELPDTPEVMLGYGKALYMTGDFAQSATILEKASTRTADPVLYTNLGNVYLKLDKYDLSEKSYKKAISIIPNKLYPRYLLAMMYLKTGDSVKARQTAFYIVNMPVSIPSPASRQITFEMKNLLVKTEKSR
ncbi:O-antigen ligase family protein [Larkinella knui]